MRPVKHLNMRRLLGLLSGPLTIATCTLLLNVPPAWAQQASGIAGTVRDSSGLAMPGVTVEAASPALIEKVRTVVTDGEGESTIVRSFGRVSSTVTFTLSGFSIAKRIEVILPPGSPANINVTMQVGTLAETVVVTGASPVVDTQSMRKQETLNTSALDALPSGAIGVQTLAYVTPGFAATQADVGGTRDTWSAQGNYTFFHGKTGTRASFDGFRNQYFIGAASGVGYITDSGNIQELQLETSGMGAESGSGSTSLNAIPKSGSKHLRRRPRRLLLERRKHAGRERPEVTLNDWAQGNPALLSTAGIISPRRCSGSTAWARSSAARSSRTRSGSSPRSRVGARRSSSRAPSITRCRGHGKIPGSGRRRPDADAVLSRSAGHAVRHDGAGYEPARPPASTGTGTTRAASPPR